MTEITETIPHITVPETVYVDNTCLSDFAQCKLKAYLRHGLGYTGWDAKHAAEAGKGIHEALDAWFSGASKSEAVQKFLDHYQPIVDDDPPYKDNLSPQNLIEILGDWFDRNPPDSMPFRVERKRDIEAGFTVPFIDDHEGVLIALFGRIDGRVTDHMGMVRVLEHKTTGMVTQDWVEQFKFNSQIDTYVWALRELTSEHVVGAYVNAIETKLIPGRTGRPRKCRTHPTYKTDECGLWHLNHRIFSVDRTEWQLAAWHQSATVLAKSYVDMLMNPQEEVIANGVFAKQNFKTACTYCEFNDFCRMGRPWDKLDKLAKHDPWSPFEV